jgi:hypothetical protein
VQSVFQSSCIHCVSVVVLPQHDIQGIRVVENESCASKDTPPLADVRYMPVAGMQTNAEALKSSIPLLVHIVWLEDATCSERSSKLA